MLKRAFVLGVFLLPKLLIAQGGAPLSHRIDPCGGPGNGCTDVRIFAPHNPIHAPPDPNIAARAAEQQRQQEEAARREAERIREVEIARKAEADRIERLRLEGIQQKADECRGYFTEFRGRANHDEASASSFVTNASRNLMRYPEHLPIANEHFNAESRLVYKGIIGGVLYIASPSNIEVSNWLRDTGDFTAEQLSELDSIRNMNSARLASGGSSMALACVMSANGETQASPQSFVQSSGCVALRNFVNRQLSRM